jgi:uncharacterized membrane protein
MNKVKFLLNRWFIEAFTGMAQGLFATLIAGLIIKQIGVLIGAGTVAGQLLILIGNIASALTGAGIGAGIAKQLKAGNLVIFSALIAGIVGANSVQIISQGYELNIEALKTGMIAFRAGDPIGAYAAALVATELGIFLSGKTKLDIIVIPLSMMIVTMLITVSVCPPVIKLMTAIGAGINRATELQPFLMGIIIAVSVGLLLTLPTSSAAICISIGINGLAGGAAVVGCCCQMIGFAVQSFRENKISGLIAQGLGTSMLQIPNLMRKPVILVPPVIASVICGPLSTLVFKLQCAPGGAGMGTAGLVGVITTYISSKGHISDGSLLGGIILLQFVLPAIICLVLSEWMRKRGILRAGDMALR